MATAIIRLYLFEKIGEVIGMNMYQAIPVRSLRSTMPVRARLYLVRTLSVIVFRPFGVCLHLIPTSIDGGSSNSESRFAHKCKQCG